MLTVARLSKRPRHFQSFTGLTVAEFQSLAKMLRPFVPGLRQERLLRAMPDTLRVRKFGGGRRNKLSFEDSLLSALLWLKLYPSYTLLGYLVGLDAASVCRGLKDTIVLLRGKRSPLLKRPGKPLGTIDDLRKIIPDIDEILVDATEQKTKRPQDGRTRRPFHSGKNRAFTLKTQIAIRRDGAIVHVSKTVGGRTHDLRLFRQSSLPRWLTRYAVKVYADAGYQGVQKDHPGVPFLIPLKRSRSKKILSKTERRYNRGIRKIRIFVEHAFARLKKFQVLVQAYRHVRDRYNDAFRAVAFLVNFRLRSRQVAV